MQTITPFLWFDGNAAEAAGFYSSVFYDAKIISTMNGPGGSVMGLTVALAGQQFILFNGGPMFRFNEAVSLFVRCETQDEIDAYWDKLSEGGEQQRCGWLKDKFGLSWQIVPPILAELLGDKDPVKAGRVMQAVLQMNKIDIAGLLQAYNG